jgi:hypothetical protein
MVSLSTVDRTDTLTSDAFHAYYKRPARPVVMEGLTRSWPAREKWSVEYLKRVAGERVVPLYDSKPSRDRKHQHAPAARMPLAEYLDRLAAGENDLRLFFFNLLDEAPALREDFRYPDEMGLKFFKRLPVLFMGGKGARVQMHFDIDLADIFLCHFGGPKHVMLFPPDQTRHLYHVPFSFSSLFDVRYDDPDFQTYPALRHARGYETVLNHGDVLYMPPGYWHFIRYREISFSMSLRAFPREPGNFLRMANNLLVIRTVEGLMRKLVGQPWNDWNERRAITRTHRRLGLETG